MTSDRLVQKQTEAVQAARPFVGDIGTVKALRFAEKQGLMLIHFDPVNNSWQLSDGEVYSVEYVMTSQ